MAYTTIDKPSSYFNTVTYTGDGTTNQTRAITFGFKPDWAWFKARDAGQSHIFVDSVRGGTKYLVSESTNAEGTLGVAQLFTSTGMTISNDASANSLNSSGSTKVSWGWLGSNTTASNTSGSITSTVSANTTSGFSIVSYTGTGSNATVGHGLGVAPSFLITKNRSGTDGWIVHTKAITATTWWDTRLLLASTAAAGSGAGYLTAEPTSTLFAISSFSAINASGNNYITYCFAEKKGFSKFGSYTGNGSTDGTFVYTGFKPAFVLVKRSNAAVSWYVFDSKRNTYNAVNLQLSPNLSNAEASDFALDFLSNGFKFRIADSFVNGNGDPYIYMAFAENPFVSSKGIPACAR